MLGGGTGIEEGPDAALFPLAGTNTGTKWTSGSLSCRRRLREWKRPLRGFLPPNAPVLERWGCPYVAVRRAVVWGRLRSVL